MSQQDLFEDNRPEKSQDAIRIYLSHSNKNAVSELSGLYELSVNAFYAAVHAGMSELPIEKEISRFIEKVLDAGGKTKNSKLADDRIAAEQAASDRGDPDVLTVLKTAGRVQHEIHRITGFLRFSQGTNGVYTARCSPDYFILPALAEHFTLRFGETPWAIIDERRKLCLCRNAGGQVMLINAEEAGEEKECSVFWEDLWRLYHRSINNEGRKNPGLQRKFMPGRYQKYLTELK